MDQKFDAILVGAGQAAPSLAKRLADSGRSIAFAERDKFGGTCVNNGCTPTKALVASAHAAHLARRGHDFGITLSGPVMADIPKVMARKDRIVHESSSGVESSLRELKGCTVFTETAMFEDARHIRVGDTILEAPEIFLNVGARAVVPRIDGLDHVPFLTNTSVLELKTLPEHLVILGGSYIAVEFAQIFRRFGSEVTVLQKGDRLVTREDEDIADAIRKILEGEGIRVETGANANKVQISGDQIEVLWPGGHAAGSHLLVAVGRKPNTDDLGLERAGIPVTQQGYIPVNDRLETPTAGIWALGDCNGRGAFTHTSYNDFEIVAANLLDGEDRKVTDRITAYNIYIDPPLGRCGMTETEVKRSGRKALKGVRPMTKVSRAVEKGETQGFMKVIVDEESQLILGASLLGTGCDEVVQSVLDVMYARKPYTLLTHAVHIHPTVTELIPTLLEDLKPLY